MTENREHEFTLKIMTLNVWGLPDYFCKDKATRMHAIGEHISSFEYDVVCLQELWCSQDYNLILSYTRNKMPYSHYFHSGLIGSGLCVLSKWPISDALFYKWPLNGYFHMIHHGDWFGGKGVGLIRVNVNGILLNVYTAHLHAQYDRTNDKYIAHRIAQAFDTAMFIRLTSGNVALKVLAGDLNANPDDICCRIIRVIGNLEDTYIAHKPDCALGTNECHRNSYSCELAKNKLLYGDRIDYILYNEGPGVYSEVDSYWFPLEETIPGKTFSYSDHEAIACQISVRTKNQIQGIHLATQLAKDNEAAPILEECLSLFAEATHIIQSNARMYYLYSVCFMLALVIIPLFSDFPSRYNVSYHVTVVTIMLFLAFSLIMAIIWCKTEMKAILGAKTGMQLLLHEIRQMY